MYLNSSYRDNAKPARALRVITAQMYAVFSQVTTS